jgi:1,4-alpha-glucan branching enzyme
MGWMHDSLDYVALDPYFRKFNHNRMTFSLTYSFSEKFLLPISHDEVVYGKKSLLGRMSGDYKEKFATARAYAVFMMTHPGKKLMFMGNEIGQFNEWDYAGQIEWFLLDYDAHARLQLFHSELNNFYLEHPELWEVDDSWDGFKWIDADNGDMSVYSYRRIAKDGRELIIILNFTPVVRSGFKIGVPYGTPYNEIFNSDDMKYGGSGMVNPGLLTPEKTGANLLPYSLSLTLPPLGAVILKTDKKPQVRAGGRIRRRTVITPIKFLMTFM